MLHLLRFLIATTTLFPTILQASELCSFNVGEQAEPISRERLWETLGEIETEYDQFTTREAHFEAQREALGDLAGDDIVFEVAANRWALAYNVEQQRLDIPVGFFQRIESINEFVAAPLLEMDSAELMLSEIEAYSILNDDDETVVLLGRTWPSFELNRRRFRANQNDDAFFGFQPDLVIDRQLGDTTITISTPAFSIPLLPDAARALYDQIQFFVSANTLDSRVGIDSDFGQETYYISVDINCAALVGANDTVLRVLPATQTPFVYRLNMQ
jgi:hypothetical protein